MCEIIPAVYKVLTWAVSELKAQMGPAEAVYGDGQFDDLTPARTVVVVEDKRAVLADVVFSWAQTNALLIKDRRNGNCLLLCGFIVCIKVCDTNIYDGLM